MNTQPNIVLFVADQLIASMTGAYGHPSAITPNLDKLASEGVTFDSAYSTVPVCVPARASLLSGCYAATTGCYDNGGILPADWPTHNHYLNIAGYDTALSGKAHFIGPDQLHGFKERFMTDIYPSGFRFMPQRGSDMAPQNLHPNPIAIDYTKEHSGVRQYSMQMAYDEEAMFHSKVFLSRKRTQMSGSGQEPIPARDEKPFFLMVSLNHPHEPFHVTQRHWDLYEDVDIPIPEIPEHYKDHLSDLDISLNKLHGCDKVDVTNADNLKHLYRAYLSSVSYVDEKLGELRSMLEEFGLSKNTVIILLSDHGDMLGDRGMVQKRTFYERVARIPLIIHSPENNRLGTPGTRISEPVSIVDITPTILDIANIQDYMPMDGNSLLPLINGESDPARTVFCENYSEGVDRVCLMMRQDKWKYCYFHGSDQHQLFNLENDPDERDNLAQNLKYRDICARMEMKILERFDVEELEHQAQISFKKKSIVQDSLLSEGQQTWNYNPPKDVDNMYWRDK